jgi:hypothetical protein
MGRDGGRRGGSSHTAVAVAPLFSNLNDWAVWVATGVLCSGAFARHGLFAAGLYWALTAVVSVVDPSLHSLQMLNLVAVVYDLSFELHRLYLLVRAHGRDRPLRVSPFSGVEGREPAAGGQRADV